MATLIKGSKLLDGKGAALDNAAVLVEDGRIVAVGSQSELAPQPGVDIIDGAGKTIMPGLVDAHVHLVKTNTPDCILRDGRRFFLLEKVVDWPGIVTLSFDHDFLRVR